MSQPPLQVVAAGEVEEPKFTAKKRRTNCSQEFAGTVVSLFFTFPFLLWVFTLIRRIAANAARDYDCEGLLRADPFDEAVLVLSLIWISLVCYFAISILFGNWQASLGLLLLVVISSGVIAGFPNLENRATFGIFHSSSPKLPRNSNNSEYWNSNIRTCGCRNEACEDLVYRKYLIKIHDVEDFDSSDYSKLPPNYEPGRHRSPAHDLNGTSGDNKKLVTDGSNSSRRRYHEVCYTKEARYGYKGNSTLCYDCYDGCEDKFLKDEQRNRWSLGNALYLHSLLLIAVNLTAFLAESWARYME